jgi:hypothetical protein
MLILRFGSRGVSDNRIGVRVLSMRHILPVRCVHCVIEQIACYAR